MGLSSLSPWAQSWVSSVSCRNLKLLAGLLPHFQDIRLRARYPSLFGVSGSELGLLP